jgi:serine/threonine protein kinase
LTDPSAVQRFDWDARTVARLTHSSLIAVHDVGVDNGVPYLVMDLVEGHNLTRCSPPRPLARR